MTARKASRINGLEYAKEGTEWLALAEDGSVVARRKIEKGDSGEALRRLVEDVYALNRQLALKRDEYRCIECKSFRQLEADHIVARSKGRDDRVENLRTLCHTCHMKRHGYKIGATA